MNSHPSPVKSKNPAQKSGGKTVAKVFVSLAVGFTAIGILRFFMKGKNHDVGVVAEDTKETKKEVALEARDEIKDHMRRIGQRGAQKSAEVRRAKAKAKKDELLAQGDIRNIVHGENVDDEKDGEIAS